MLEVKEAGGTCSPIVAARDGPWAAQYNGHLAEPYLTVHSRTRGTRAPRARLERLGFDNLAVGTSKIVRQRL